LGFRTAIRLRIGATARQEASIEIPTAFDNKKIFLGPIVMTGYGLDAGQMADRLAECEQHHTYTAYVRMTCMNLDYVWYL
jgi:hypothetical protein